MKIRFTVLAIAFLTIILPARMDDALAQSDSPINDLAWNADDTVLAIPHDDGIVEFFYTANQSIFSLQLAANAILDVEWSPTDTNLLIVGALGEDPQLFEIQGANFTLIREFPNNQFAANDIRWSPDGQLVAFLGAITNALLPQTSIVVWEIDASEPLRTYTEEYTEYAYNDIAWQPDSAHNLLYTVGYIGLNSVIRLQNVDTDSILWTYTDDGLYRIEISWDDSGTRFVSLTNPVEGARVRIHNATNGEVTSELSVQPFFISFGDWGPGDMIALTVLNTIEIWDAATLEPVEIISASVNNLTWRSTGEITYSDDSRSIITIMPESVSDIRNSHDTTPTPTNATQP